MKEGGCSLAPLGTFEGKVPAEAWPRSPRRRPIKARHLHGRDQRRGAEIQLMDKAGTGEAEIVLRLDAITKRFGPLVANDAISLDLKRGEAVALLGENGAGKTTLMNILFGHYVADEGSVEVSASRLPPGDPRAALAAGIGMVHQHFTLADKMSVLENIALGSADVLAALRPAGATARIANLPGNSASRSIPKAHQRSVGWRAPAGGDPQGALPRGAHPHPGRADGGADAAETEALFATLRKLMAGGLSIIFISHKLNEVMAISDRVVVLRAGRSPAKARTADTNRRNLPR
jgi:general nucleoside transport system ATP-binding protein